MANILNEKYTTSCSIAWAQPIELKLFKMTTNIYKVFQFLCPLGILFGVLQTVNMLCKCLLHDIQIHPFRVACLFESICNICSDVPYILYGHHLPDGHHLNCRAHHAPQQPHPSCLAYVTVLQVRSRLEIKK